MLNFIFLYAKPELFLFSIYMQAEKEREGMGGRECVRRGRDRGRRRRIGKGRRREKREEKRGREGECIYIWRNRDIERGEEGKRKKGS